MKYGFPFVRYGFLAVAPHEGAWIEILLSLHIKWECMVAPHEGAWIEISTSWQPISKLVVAPHEGAWIEIRRMDNDGINLECEILRKSIEH